jgi:hypothetical protein
MKRIFLTTIILHLLIINMNAQNTIGTQKDLVKKNYPKIDSLIDDFEKYTANMDFYIRGSFEKYTDRTEDFIDQLIIQLANTVPASIKPSMVQTNITNIAYPKYFSDYISSKDFKIFKSKPPIYIGKFNNKQDSLRYTIYTGLSYLYSMNSSVDSSFSKFSHIDSIIKVAEFINADTIIKFTTFSVTDKDKINKIYLDCLILRDDYRYAKKLGYGKQLPEEGKKGFRELYKNKPNYIQYFDYIDKLNKSELDKHNKSE